MHLGFVRIGASAKETSSTRLLRAATPAPAAGENGARPADEPLRAHNIAIEVAQHFEKIVVKSIFGEIWFRSDCRCDIINEIVVEDSCFGSLNTDDLAARGFEGL